MMQPSLKLQEAESVDLEDLLEHPGIKPMWRVADECLRLIQMDVINYDLSNGTPEQLVQMKARAEGAARLLLALRKQLAKKPRT